MFSSIVLHSLKKKTETRDESEVAFDHDLELFINLVGNLLLKLSLETIALFYLAHPGSCASAGSKHNWGLYLSINVKRSITTRL